MPNQFSNERRSQTDRRRSRSIPVARSLCVKSATISFKGFLPKGPFFAKALRNLALHLARHPAWTPLPTVTAGSSRTLPPRVALLAGTSVEQIRLVFDDLRIEGLKLKPPRRRRAENIECLPHGPFVDDLETLTRSRSRRLSKQLHLA
jgi:hypothetical protein